MVIATQNQREEALEERILSIKTFSEAFVNYIKVSSDITSEANKLIVNDPSENVDLQAQRTNLINKFSIVKTQLEVQKFQYQQLSNEIDELNKFYSKDINEKKLELKRSLLIGNKKLEELSQKRVEVHEINRIIDGFNDRYITFDYTEDEIKEAFGEDTEKVLNKAFKRTVKNDKGEEVQKYQIKTTLDKSIPTLNKIKTELIESLSLYDKEIQELKSEYINNVRKFEAIKQILEEDVMDIDEEKA